MIIKSACSSVVNVCNKHDDHRATEVRQRTLDNIRRREEEEESKRTQTLKKIDAKCRRIEEKNAITEVRM